MTLHRNSPTSPGVIPELALRVRGSRDVWVVYVPRKETLGLSAAISPALARELAQDLLTTPAPLSQLSASPPYLTSHIRLSD